MIIAIFTLLWRELYHNLAYFTMRLLHGLSIFHLPVFHGLSFFEGLIRLNCAVCPHQPCGTEDMVKTLNIHAFLHRHPWRHPLRNRTCPCQSRQRWTAWPSSIRRVCSPGSRWRRNARVCARAYGIVASRWSLPPNLCKKVQEIFNGLIRSSATD